jgi:hypothetical protein
VDPILEEEEGDISLYDIANNIHSEGLVAKEIDNDFQFGEEEENKEEEEEEEDELELSDSVEPGESSEVTISTYHL